VQCFGVQCNVIGWIAMWPTVICYVPDSTSCQGFRDKIIRCLLIMCFMVIYIEARFPISMFISMVIGFSYLLKLTHWVALNQSDLLYRLYNFTMAKLAMPNCSTCWVKHKHICPKCRKPRKFGTMLGKI
jgi:hypothetical protein